MKLFNVAVLNDYETESIMIVAKSESEALKKAYEMDWACYIDAWAYEIREIDGYRVSLTKVE